MIKSIYLSSITVVSSEFLLDDQNIDVHLLVVLKCLYGMHSNISVMKLLRIVAMALLEIPVSGWTCLRTEI